MINRVLEFVMILKEPSIKLQKWINTLFQRLKIFCIAVWWQIIYNIGYEPGILLDKPSKKFVVINTLKGLFQYNRLPFGIASVPGIFQRVIDSLLQGIPGIVAYLDDILVTGLSNTEHLESLKEVLTRL